MEWFEELKMYNKFKHVELEDARKISPDFPPKALKCTITLEEFDRLIEIAEFYGVCDCPSKHKLSCPYHEDWTPK